MSSRLFQSLARQAVHASRLATVQGKLPATRSVWQSTALRTRQTTLVNQFDNALWSSRQFSTQGSDESKKEDASDAVEEDSAEEKEEEEEGVNSEELLEKINALEEAENKARDDMLRVLADMENVRKIARKDVDDAKMYSIKKFAKSLLEVADNLNRAIESVPEDVQNDSNIDPNLKNLLEGVKMTEVQLQKAFNDNGVVKYGEVGEAFDPHVHEAQFHMPDPSKDPNTVGAIIFHGYKIKDRVLRHAAVGVVQK